MASGDRRSRTSLLRARLPARKLERSYASIDELEDEFLAGLQDRKLEALIADYLVATLVARVDGAEPVFVEKYQRIVVRLPKVDADVDPTLTAQDFRKRPTRCFLRDDVERFDLAARGELLERVQPREAGEDGEVARLASAMPALATRRRHGAARRSRSCSSRSVARCMHAQPTFAIASQTTRECVPSTAGSSSENGTSSVRSRG